MLRTLSVLIGTIFTPSLFSQPCLVTSDPQRITALETLAGTLRPNLTPVGPSRRVVIAIFPGWIPAEQRDDVASTLTGFYKSANKTKSLSLAVFNGKGFTVDDPPESAKAWQKAVREALLPLPETTAPPSAAHLYSTVASSLAAIGGDWSSVILAGRLPDLTPEVRDYGLAWVSSRICGAKVRLSYWSIGGGPSAFWSAVVDLTGGNPELQTATDVIEQSERRALEQASWPELPVSFGFLLSHAKLQSSTAGGAPSELPILSAAAGASLPDPERYAELLSIERQLSEQASVKERSETQVHQMRALAEQALAINARSPIALRVEADYHENAHDYQTATGFLEKLIEIEPHNAALQAELGHCRFAAGNLEGAEKALMIAHEAKAGGAAVALELARIRLASKDDAGALPFLEETLTFDSRATELWYARADAAARIGDNAKVADSLEHALAIDAQNLPRRTSLVQLYVGRRSAEDALRHIRIVMSALPLDPVTRRQYAEFLDQLNRPAEALLVWKKVIDSDPANEPAYYRVAQLLLDGSSVAESLAAAETGLSAAPGSARLYLIKAESLNRQDRYFEARQTLRDAAKTVEDVDLLERLAQMEDVSGQSAPEAYRALFVARDKAASKSPEPVRTLERALEVSVRDGDGKAAAYFRTRLETAGRPALSDWAKPDVGKRGSTAVVSGGLEALAFIAQMHFQSPQSFFTEYCKTLAVRATTPDINQRNLYLEGIRNYFQQLSQLKALGRRKENATEIVISLSDKKIRQQSEKILAVLGWKLKFNKTAVTLEAGEKSSQARRQETASALALDEVGIQQALESGKSYTFEIPDELAPVLLGESTWMSTFFPNSSTAKLAGGFAEALLADPRVAKTYAALSAISSRAVSALTAGADLKTLAEKHADLLFRYGSAFALQGDHAAVPGGPGAEAVWESIVGVAPARPKEFFRALLQKDDGKLLAYFATVGQVDVDHQRFFTRSAPRTARFYQLFRDSEDLLRGAGKLARNSFAEFLGATPLDPELRVLFPGGPEVWALAKGSSSSASKNAKMVRKLSRITAPEQEDEILDRLARTHYMLRGERVSEINNFVAVARIDEHRPDPLDEASALLLAQNYGSDKPAYPYFAALTGLGQSQFEHFFSLIEQLSAVQRVDLNVILGELHSVIELIALAQDSGSLKAKDATDLFDQICVQFAKANAPAGYTASSLETVRELLRRSSHGETDADPDRALENLLLGGGAPGRFELGGESRQVDASGMRRSAYRKVLAEQKVTSLKTLLDFYDNLQDLIHGRGSAVEHAKALDNLRASLLTVELPKKTKTSEIDRKLVMTFNEAKVAELISRLKQRIARKKVNQKDVEEICGELASLISPQVKLALSGIVYGYFLSPGDLLVSQDPLLLRKHRFLSFSGFDKGLLAPSGLASSNGGLGSYLEGGFADFPIAAGQIAFSGAQPPPNTGPIAEAQMAALRATDWNRLNEKDLITFGLRLRLAREWVLHTAIDAKLLDGLAEAAEGLLSPARKAELLDRIAARDWDGAFGNLTVGDLYSLSERYLERYSSDSWQSPVLTELRRDPDAADDTRLRPLGGSASDLLGCSHSHLEVLGAYEDYEGLLLPNKLAQRTAEFKLYLADFAGSAGIPPAALNALAQPVALQIIKGMKMTDMNDWRGAHRAFAGLDEKAVLMVIAGQK